VRTLSFSARILVLLGRYQLIPVNVEPSLPSAGTTLVQRWYNAMLVQCWYNIQVVGRQLWKVQKCYPWAILYTYILNISMFVSRNGHTHKTYALAILATYHAFLIFEVSDICYDKIDGSTSSLKYYTNKKQKTIFDGVTMDQSISSSSSLVYRHARYLVLVGHCCAWQI